MLYAALNCWSSLLPALKDACTNWLRPSISSSESEIQTNMKLVFAAQRRNTRTNWVVFTRFGTVHWITRPLTPTETFYIENEFACLFSAYMSAIGKKKLATKRHFASRLFMHLLPLSVIIFTILFFAGFSWKTCFALIFRFSHVCWHVAWSFVVVFANIIFVIAVVHSLD